MKDSGIEWLGEIPKHWNSSVFKRIFFRHDSGAWGDEQKNNSDDLICIRIADFDYERLRIKQHIEFTIRNYKEETVLNLRLENRDILIEKSGGGDKTPVGRTVIYDLEDSALFANFMDRLRVKENYSPYFVVYVFSVFYGTGIIRKYIKQTIGIQNLDINAYLSSEKIFFPDLKEQEEIVAYLNHRCQLIDKVIIATRKQIETLQEYKASLISAVVTGNVDIQDVHIDEIFELETMDELDTEIEAEELTKD